MNATFQVALLCISFLFEGFSPSFIIPTVVDDRPAHIGACDGKAVRPLDVLVASVTRQGGRQKREEVRLRGKRKAAGFQQCSGTPSPGDQQACGDDQCWVVLVLEPSPADQTFFEYIFFPTGA